MKTPFSSCRATENSDAPNESINDLKAYLDGELSPLRRLIVQFHLRQCESCRAEVQAMTQISHDLQNSEGAAPSLAPELRERILDNLPAVPPSSSSLAAPASRQSRNPRWELIGNYGMALGLVAIVGVGVMTLSGKRISNTFNKAADQLEGYRGESSGSSTRSVISGKSVAEGRTSGSAGGPPAAAPITKALPNIGADAEGVAGKPAANVYERAYKTEKSLANQRLAQIERRESSPTGKGKFPAVPGDTSNLPASLRRVHKEARLTVAVDDIEAKSAAAEQSIRAAGGYVVSNDLSTGADNRKSASLDLRVPVGRFDSIVGELSRMGEVRAKQVTGEDITEQFSDSQQAKNVLSNELSIREAQLKAALDKIAKAQKKNRPADPWELRAEVRRLRVEAAQARARLELMRKLSDLSVVSLQLTEKSLKPTNGFSQEMNETMSGAGDTFMAAARLPIKLLIWAFAYSPLWLPLLLAYRLLARRMAPPAQLPGQNVASSTVPSVAPSGPPAGASHDAR